MYVEGSMDFTNGTQVLSGTSDVVGTNVKDELSAKLAFAGSGGRGKIFITVSGPAVNADNTFRARFVAAANAALTTTPDILADTGVSQANFSTTLVAGQVQRVYELTPCDQPTARQFYGVIFTQGGTTPAFTVTAQYVEAAQSNLIK